MLRYSSIVVQNIIFEFKIIMYRLIAAKETCNMGVSTSWNEMRNYGNIIQPCLGWKA